MGLSKQAVAIATPFTLAGLLASAVTTATAQVQSQPNQQPPDSVVAVVADAMSLPFVPPDQRPVFGTFWEVRSSLPCVTAPLPCPPLDANTPVYSIGDPIVGGQFLVDQTAGLVISLQALSSRRALSSMTTASILQAQVEELQTFVAWVQARQAYAESHPTDQMGRLSLDGGGVYGPMDFSYTADDLWLEVLTVTNATGIFVVHPPEAEAATGAYDLFMTTNLSLNVPGLSLTNWLWLLRTGPGETNLLVPDLWADQAYFMLGRTNDTDADGMSDAYEHLVSHTSPTNQDAPIVTSQPLSQTIYSRDTVTFSVTAVGPQPLVYQWLFSETPLPGETNASLSLLNAQGGQAGDYSVQVSSPFGLSTLSSNATLTVYSSGWPFIPLIGPRQDYTFKRAATYLVYSPVELYGRTVIEGGSVIKFDTFTNASLQVKGTLVTDATAYYPAMLTRIEDDSVGAPIWGEPAPLGPSSNGCAYLDLSSAQPAPSSISNLHLAYADQALTTPVASGRLDVWDCQFVQCGSAVAPGHSASVGFHNVLLAECTAAVAASTNFAAIEGEHITADATNFWSGPYAPTWIALTNSIVLGTLAGGSAFSSQCVALNPSATNFQTSAGGHYYLAAGSALRGAGVTNISPPLLALLRHKTTTPPVAFPAFTVMGGEMALHPQAPRYAGGCPDLGYSYQALDFTLAPLLLDAGASMTIHPGTAVGFRNDPDGDLWTWYSLVVRQGARLVSLGTPTHPNVLAPVHYVQEGPFASTVHTLLIPDLEPNPESLPSPVLDFRFTDFYFPAEDFILQAGFSWDFFGGTSPSSSMQWNLSECHLHGGGIMLGTPWPDDPYPFYEAGSLSWFNNLFDRVKITLNPTYYADWGEINVDLRFHAYNNLFRDQTFFLNPLPTSGGNWLFKDNLFDKMAFEPYWTGPLDHDHTAYWLRLPSELTASYHTNSLPVNNDDGGMDAVNDQILAGPPPYQRGPLGNYYLPIATPLYHAGSRTAAHVGLFHYTTRVDQTKEGSGQMVSIGLHYVATAGLGSSQPKDSDGDGIPDFVENASGTGTVGPNETDWQTAYTVSGIYDPTNTVYDDIDLSGSGLVGRVKRAVGIGPFETANPLELIPTAFDAEWGIMTYEFPLNFDTLTNAGSLRLNMDGIDVTLEDFCRATNGHALLNWNTTYDPPGLHFLQARLTLTGPADDRAVMSGLGILVSYYSTNLAQFFESDALYDDSTAFLDAQLASQDAEYTIRLYDPSTTPPAFIAAITNSTSNGIIQEDWNVTCDDGLTTFTGAQVKAVFEITAPGQSGAPSTQRQHARTLNRIQTRERVSASGYDGFDIAYFYTPRNNELRSVFAQTVWDGMQGVVDTLTMPEWPWDVYYSTFNLYGWPTIFDGYPGYLGSRDAVTNFLYPDLGSGTTKNFYGYGHGNKAYLGTKNDEAFMTASEVAKVLANEYKTRGGLCVTNPYRFVFLDGCKTASGKEWRQAFGIMPLWATNQARRYSLGPQAYVGWGEVKADYFGGLYTTNGADIHDSRIVAEAYTQTLQWFFLDWMNGASLYQCILNASDTNQAPCAFPVPANKTLVAKSGLETVAINNSTNTSRIYVVGHSGLTVTGLIPGHDNQFPSPIDVERKR